MPTVFNFCGIYFEKNINHVVFSGEVGGESFIIEIADYELT